MAHLLKALQYSTDHTLGGGIRPGKLRIFRFQLPQAYLHFVIFKVRDLRRVFVIIPPGMIKQLFGQLLHLFLDIHHGCTLLFIGSVIIP